MSAPLLTLFTFIVGGTSSALAAFSLHQPSYSGTPFHRPLSYDFGFYSSFDYQGKNTFGWKYRNYMVGQGKQNKRWWQRTFEKLKQEGNNDNSFKKAQKAWWFEGEDSLNRICRKAYIDLAENVSKDGYSLKEEDIWKYCSVLGFKPKTLDKGKDENPTSGTIGSSHKTKLISTKDPINEPFWKMRHDEFLRVLGRNTTSTFFSPALNNSGTTIKEKCQEAYQKQSTDNSVTLAEVIKYCSFEDYLTASQ